MTAAILRISPLIRFALGADCRRSQSRSSRVHHAQHSCDEAHVCIMDSRQNVRFQDADDLERLQAEFEASKHSPSASVSNLRSPARPSVQHPSRATAAAAAAPAPQATYQPLMVLGSITEKGTEHLNAGSENRKGGAKPPQPTAQSFPLAKHRSSGRVSTPPLLPKLRRLTHVAVYEGPLLHPLSSPVTI